jgi:hypothetical protein
MEIHTALEAGGMAVIVTARDFDTPEAYRYHPQLLRFQVGEMPEEFSELLERVPANARVMLIAGELPTATYTAVRKVAERRNIPYVQRRNAPAVEAALDALFPKRLGATIAEQAGSSNGSSNGGSSGRADPAVGPTLEGKGWLTTFLRDHVDFKRGNAEEARRLLPIIQQRGRATTLGSVAQAITQLRRKTGAQGERPKSAMSAQDRALSVLDEALVKLSDLQAALQLTREYLATTEGENLALKEKLARVAKLIE